MATQLDSFDRAAFEFKRLAYQFDQSMAMVAMRVAYTGHNLAIKYSSGPVKSKDMVETRPFSLRHASPLLPPDIINVQTGDFLRDWQTGGRRTANGYDIRIRNDNFVTQFFGGTRYSHARPIEDTLRSEIGESAEQEVQDAVGRLLSGYA